LFWPQPETSAAIASINVVPADVAALMAHPLGKFKVE
jgi:hypothetical protein